MRLGALGVARADLGKIDGLCHQSSAHRLVGHRVLVLYPVAVCLDNPLELPFGNHLARIAGEVGNRALEHGTLTAVGIYHTLLVGHFPVVVRRTVALADDA